MRRSGVKRLASTDAASLSLLNSVAPEEMVERLAAASKKEALATLARRAAAQLNVDSGALLDALVARERLSSTGIGGGGAIPHAAVGRRSTSRRLTTSRSTWRSWQRQRTTGLRLSGCLFARNPHVPGAMTGIRSLIIGARAIGARFSPAPHSAPARNSAC